MKRIFFFSLICFFCFATWCGCSKEQKGSIYGVVTDKATGEAIKTAGVELHPIGLKTVTGSNGSFEFLDLEVGTYTLFVTKTGYVDYKSSPIEIKSGQQVPGNVQLEKAPHALRVVNSDLQDINSLDFGDQEDDVSRSFVIFNDGSEALEWEITITASWLHVSKQSGTLNPNKQQSIIATIDRDLLLHGENVTTMHITSDDGAKELTVIATGVSPIVTLPVTECSGTTAVLNGKLARVGDPVYTEMGFVYGTMPTPSTSNGATKVSISNVQLGNFSEAVSNITQGATYYVRAYAKNNTTTDYGSTVSFVAENPQYVIIQSAGLMVQKNDLGYTNWESANTMCNNSTIGDLSDWRLPTLDELYVLYNNRDFIGGFTTGIYLSSTGYSGDNRFHAAISFYTGTIVQAYNWDEYYFRAVRTISN